MVRTIAANNYRIIEGDYSKMEFTNILTWIFTEKIDGTNIRILYSDGNVYIGGRSDEAEIPSQLLPVLTSKFTKELMKAIFPPKEGMTTPPTVELFGEGYGPGIHGGGTYRSDPGFILFDVWIDGWWIERRNVEDIAKKLGIPVVPILGIGSIRFGVDMVKSKTPSLVSKEPRVIEGIVARSLPMVMFRDGTPLMWKLKVKDYMVKNE